MPDWTAAILRSLSSARLAPGDEAEIADELRQHLGDRYAELRASGLGESDAERETLRELGEGDLLGSVIAHLRTTPPPPPPVGVAGRARIGGVLMDFRIGARLLRRSPGFTSAAVVTLALGIGAAITIFGLVNALLLRPLPAVASPRGLVQLGATTAGSGFGTFSFPEYVDYAAGRRTLSAIAAYYAAPVHLVSSPDGTAERLRVGVVSESYFRTLGIQAAAGRLLLGDDHGAPGASPVAVLSHRLWQSRFGGDPTIVGRQVQLNAHPYTIVGIAAEDFAGTDLGAPLDLFIPIAMIGQLRPGFASALDARDAYWLRLFGRLAPGMRPRDASAELAAAAATLAVTHSTEPRGVGVATGLGFPPDVREELQSVSRILLGAVALVLLIACANVANLLLVRGTTRTREMALRTSLGATRGRLVRQLLAESLVLASIGGAAGIGLGLLLARLVVKLPLVGTRSPDLHLPLDWRVLGFATALAGGSALLFGLPAALRGTRLDLASTLREGPIGGDRTRSRIRSSLLALQLAVSLVLLIGAGLLARSLEAIHASRPGFETRSVVLAAADVALQGLDEGRGRAYYDALEQGAANLPGAQAAGLAYMLPFGPGAWESRAYRDDEPLSDPGAGTAADVNVATRSWFDAMGLRLLSGRAFADTDRAGAPGVAIVDETLARALWQRVDVTGRRIRMGQSEEVLEVVGVVARARYRSLLEAPRATLYRPFGQMYQSPMTLHVRTAGDPAHLIPALHRLGQRVDRTVPLHRVETMEDRLDASVAPQRTGLSLIASAGALALTLAAIGLYASMSFLVASRTREFGIRMALGANAGAVLRTVVLESTRTAAIGAVIGIALAIPAMRLIRARLHGVAPDDPATFAVAAVVLIVVATLAAYPPARRATRIDPIIALRQD